MSEDAERSSSASGMLPHIAGLVLARGGSKGVPRKNVRLIAGEPLIGFALKPMIECRYFSSVWVSTDDSEVAEIAAKYNAKIHWRNSETANDSSSSLAAVREFLKSHSEIEVVALVQCTSPCLTKEYLDKACVKILQENYDSVFSVNRQHKLRWKEVEKGDNTTALNFDPKNRPRRQDWKGELVESGHFYFSTRSLIQEGLHQGGRCGYIEMPAEMCIEIDTELDFVVAEQMLRMLQTQKLSASENNLR